MIRIRTTGWVAFAVGCALLLAGCPQEDCGNGELDPNEVCDNGPSNANAPNACRTYCEVPACGDEIVDDAVEWGCEQCDDSTDTTCGDDCRVLPAVPCDAMTTTMCCGDGVVDMDEDCDDGNATNLDGCESNCTVTPAACMS